MLFALFALSVLAAGIASSRAIEARWGDREATGPFERAASAGVAAIAIAVALDWSLALLHLFTRASLVVASVGILAASARPALRALRAPSIPRVVAIAIAPPILWTAYSTVRGAIVFPFVSDALAYHLPKALLVARTHGYSAFDGPDMRMTSFPADYELLCADVLALERSEHLLVLVAIATYVLFGLVAAAMAERWWGRGKVHTTLAAILALGVPNAILASGAPKNDLLLAAAVLAAAHYGARWAARGERAALAFAIAAAFLAIGTKPTAAVLALALAPCVAWRARRASVAWGEVAAWIGGGAIAGLLLGGAAYVVNLVELGRPLGVAERTGYGAWEHAWMFPVLAFLRPFSLGESVWVPWQNKTWFWPQYDLYYSTFGPIASLLALALPFAIARRPRDDRAVERALASIAILVTFFAILPARVQEPPLGLFLGYVRYTIFAPVAIFLWTIVPWSRRGAREGAAALFVAGASFAYFAARDAIDDQYVPFDFVAAVARGDRPPRAIATWTERAGSWVDEHAGPEDVIAFDGATDTWVYPAYGRELRRRVVFLHSKLGEPTAIPDDARWVAIDRSWNIAFGAPGFDDFSTYYEHTLVGAPLPEDLAVFGQLSRDPRWRLAYHNARMNQAVFQRIDR